MKPSDFTIGQEVFFRYSDARRHSHTTPLIALFVVKNTGRKWVEAAYRPGDRAVWKFEAETLAMDGEGFGSPGRIYLSADDFVRDQELERAWVDFRRLVDRGYSRPAHLDLADIVNMAAIMKGPGE